MRDSFGFLVAGEGNFPAATSCASVDASRPAERVPRRRRAAGPPPAASSKLGVVCAGLCRGSRRAVAEHLQRSTANLCRSRRAPPGVGPPRQASNAGCDPQICFFGAGFACPGSRFGRLFVTAASRNLFYRAWVERTHC